jgi:hypothetical protein
MALSEVRSADAGGIDRISRAMLVDEFVMAIFIVRSSNLDVR